MKALIDTNVILDVLSDRASFVSHSKIIWELCESKKINGYICALSIPNIVYILRRELDSKKIKSVVDKLHLIFNVEDLKSADTQSAADMLWSDFEDAVQTSCAVRISADFIITRNTNDYKNSPVKAISPKEYIEKIVKSGA